MLCLLRPALAFRENERLAASGYDTGARGGRWGNRLGAGARGEGQCQDHRHEGAQPTGAMLPRSRDGMVPRKDIDVQLLATKQW